MKDRKREIIIIGNKPKAAAVAKRPKTKSQPNITAIYQKEILKENLEEWYDMTYDLILLCIPAKNHIDIKKNIKELKSRNTEKVLNQ